MSEIFNYGSLKRTILLLVLTASFVTLNVWPQWPGTSNAAFQVGSTAYAQDTITNPSKVRIRRNQPAISPTTPLTTAPVTTAPTTPTTSLTSPPLVVAQVAPPVASINIATLDSGFAYAVSQNFGTPADSNSAPTQSVLRIFENGKELGPAHSLWSDISSKGLGRFLYWQNSSGGLTLYFSASDNTSPQTNGRTYTYLVGSGSPPPVASPPPPPAPAVSTLIVNGGSGPITVPAGATITVGVLNGSGNRLDCLAGYPAGVPHVPDGVSFFNYFYLNGTKTPPATGMVTASVPFPMPTTVGTYEVVLWQGCGVNAATSPTVTAVASSSPPPPPPASVPPSACSTGCFYVAPTGNDSNPGTQSAPWRTIKKAAATLTAGQTGVLMDGTYEETDIWFMTNGTASQPITLIAQHKWAAILSSISACQPALNSYASYITFQDIWIRQSPNNPGCPGFAARSTVHAWGLTGPTLTGTPSTGFVGFVMRGVKIDPGNDLGLKTNQDNTLLENNEIHDSAEVMNAVNNIVRNNLIYDGLIVKGGARNAQLYNNVLHIVGVGGGSYGLIVGGSSCVPGCVYDPSTPYEGYNIVAYNNVLINDLGGSQGLIVVRACSNCTVMNNVVIGGTIGFGPGGGITTSLNPIWRNNIVSCNGGTALGGWSGYWTGTLTVDYNNFYQCSSGIPAQVHTIVGDPKFVNPSSDWHLQPGSPALGSGGEVNVFGYNGEVIDTWRNWDGIIRTVPWNLGIY